MAKTTVTAEAIEKLAIKLMKEFEADGEPVTKEEALEMAEMEIKAKGIKNYVQSTPEKKSTKKREIKLDAEKVKIIEILASYLKENEEMDFESVAIANPQKEITFKIGESEYSISLIKHRPPKKK